MFCLPRLSVPEPFRGSGFQKAISRNRLLFPRTERNGHHFKVNDRFEPSRAYLTLWLKSNEECFSKNALPIILIKVMGD